MHSCLGRLGRAFPCQISGSCLLVSDVQVVHASFEYRARAFPFQTSGSCLPLSDVQVVPSFFSCRGRAFPPQIIWIVPSCFRLIIVLSFSGCLGRACLPLSAAQFERPARLHGYEEKSVLAWTDRVWDFRAALTLIIWGWSWFVEDIRCSHSRDTAVHADFDAPSLCTRRRGSAYPTHISHLNPDALHVSQTIGTNAR